MSTMLIVECDWELGCCDRVEGFVHGVTMTGIKQHVESKGWVECDGKHYCPLHVEAVKDKERG